LTTAVVRSNTLIPTRIIDSGEQRKWRKEDGKRTGEKRHAQRNTVFKNRGDFQVKGPFPGLEKETSQGGGNYKKRHVRKEKKKT